MSQDVALAANSTPLWRNVSFHLLWSSTFASGVGDRLIMNAALVMLGYAGEGVDNSGVASGIDFFFFLPYLLWSPFAGWLADRLPRKWLMFAADEIRGVIVLGAFLYMPAGTGIVPPDHQWKVWLTICGVGVMAATFVPAKLSIVPNVVGFGSLQRANAAVVSMGIIGNLMGFLVAGWILGDSQVPPTGAMSTMVLTSSLFYLISGWFWVFLKTPYRADAPGSGPLEATGASLFQAFRDIAQGLRYAVRHRTVRILILSAALVWTGTAVFMPALAVVNVDLYHGTATDYMNVMLMLGLGMLIGSVVLGVINPRLGNELLITAGLVGCGLFIGLQMIVPVYAIGMIIAFATGFSASVLLVPIYTLLQRSTADHIRGRVFAAKEIVTEAGKVFIAGTIWKVSGTDPYMRPAAGILSALLLGAAMYGFWRYVLRGPAPTKMLNLLYRTIRLYADSMHNLRWRGRHHIPHTGGVLLVSNHRAGLDPLLIQAATPRVIRWMMAAEYRLPGLHTILWKHIDPIDVHRGHDHDTAPVSEAIDTLKRGGVVGIFPEGGINRTDDPLRPFGEGVALIARRSGAWVVPVYVNGPAPRKRPLASFLRPSRSRVTFGEPFKVSRDDRDRAQVVTQMRQRILDLHGP